MALTRTQTTIRELKQNGTRLATYIESEIALNEASLAAGEEFRNVNSQQWLLSGSWSGSDPQQILVRDDLNVRREELRLVAHFASDLPTLEGPVTIGPIRSTAASLASWAQAIPADAAPEKFQALRSQVNGHAANLARCGDTIDSYRARLAPRPFMVVIAALTMMSVSGLIWPLSVLPGFSSATKQSMLLLFSGGLAVVVGYFAYQLLELQRLGRFRWS